MDSSPAIVSMDSSSDSADEDLKEKRSNDAVPTKHDQSNRKKPEKRSTFKILMIGLVIIGFITILYYLCPSSNTIRIQNISNSPLTITIHSETNMEVKDIYVGNRLVSMDGGDNESRRILPGVIFMKKLGGGNHGDLIGLPCPLHTRHNRTSTASPSTSTLTSPAVGPSTIPIPPAVTSFAPPSFIPPPLPSLTPFECDSYIIAGAQRDWAEAQRVAIQSLMEAVNIIGHARGIPVEPVLRPPTLECVYPGELDSFVSQILYEDEEVVQEEDEPGLETEQRGEEGSEQRAEEQIPAETGGGHGQPTESRVAAATEFMVDIATGTVVVESTPTTSTAETWAEGTPTTSTAEIGATEQAVAPSTFQFADLFLFLIRDRSSLPSAES